MCGNIEFEQAAKPGRQAKEKSEKYAFWLCSVEGWTYRVQKHLFSVCTNAEEVYRLSRKELEKIPGLMHKDIGHIIESKQTWDTDGQWQRLKQEKISFISQEQEDYPAQIRQLADAPYGLFYRGKLPDPQEFRAAIAGARMCSEYGRTAARDIARQLAQHDVAVVSGMARGIDAAGHRGALDSGGDTYAVSGCGVDICYPNYHRQLYYEIINHGGVLSEYPPGTKPLGYHFPQRNRLISALSDVVLIIEAREKSGSLITADFALEQGKEVCALPGRITDALSSGCNQLIAQGAGVILSVEDCMKELFVHAGRKKNISQKKPEITHSFEDINQKSGNLHKFSLEKDESLVYGCLGLLPAGMEEILSRTGLDVQEASQALSALMQKHYIEEVFKNCYKIITK